MRTKKIEDTEERRGRHQQPWHLKIKLKRQCHNVCTPNQKHYCKQLKKKITDEDHRMIAYLKFILEFCTKNFIEAIPDIGLKYNNYKQKAAHLSL